MANTRVDHVHLTVTTVEVFIQTMKFINEYDLWDEVQAYLEENRQTEMFVDYDAFDLFRKMLKESGRFGEEHPVYNTIIIHGG